MEPVVLHDELAALILEKLGVESGTAGRTVTIRAKPNEEEDEDVQQSGLSIASDLQSIPARLLGFVDFYKNHVKSVTTIIKGNENDKVVIRPHKRARTTKACTGQNVVIGSIYVPHALDYTVVERIEKLSKTVRSVSNLAAKGKINPHIFLQGLATCYLFHGAAYTKMEYDEEGLGLETSELHPVDAFDHWLTNNRNYLDIAGKQRNRDLEKEYEAATEGFDAVTTHLVEFQVVRSKFKERLIEKLQRLKDDVVKLPLQILVDETPLDVSQQSILEAVCEYFISAPGTFTTDATHAENATDDATSNATTDDDSTYVETTDDDSTDDDATDNATTNATVGATIEATSETSEASSITVALGLFSKECVPSDFNLISVMYAAIDTKLEQLLMHSRAVFEDCSRNNETFIICNGIHLILHKTAERLADKVVKVLPSERTRFIERFRELLTGPSIAFTELRLAEVLLEDFLKKNNDASEKHGIDAPTLQSALDLFASECVHGGEMKCDFLEVLEEALCDDVSELQSDVVASEHEGRLERCLRKTADVLVVDVDVPPRFRPAFIDCFLELLMTPAKFFVEKQRSKALHEVFEQKRDAFLRLHFPPPTTTAFSGRHQK